MGYRDREKEKQVKRKGDIFSKDACRPGLFRGNHRDFCLHEDCSSENLYKTIRREAIEYFEKRGIHWHDGIKNFPSNHFCCSQSCCVNFLFPFIKQAEKLKTVLNGVGYFVKEVLPFEKDVYAGEKSIPYIAFEYIGAENYLGEKCKGRERTRGRNFTSADFAIRFRQTDDRIHVILGEWKYTEEYKSRANKLISKNGTNRLGIYASSLKQEYCQINLEGVDPEALFFDPFDQLMRLQLLAGEMENAREMEADVVSVLHIVPRANRELMETITSEALSKSGRNIHEVWHKRIKGERFKSLYTEDLLKILFESGNDKEWLDYLNLRYMNAEAL